MQHWLADADLSGVRGSESLAKLPEAERQEWQKLWADVEHTGAKVRVEDKEISKVRDPRH
jgi:hypothetical protein